MSEASPPLCASPISIVPLELPAFVCICSFLFFGDNVKAIVGIGCHVRYCNSSIIETLYHSLAHRVVITSGALCDAGETGVLPARRTLVPRTSSLAVRMRTTL